MLMSEQASLWTALKRCLFPLDTVEDLSKINFAFLRSPHIYYSMQMARIRKCTKLGEICLSLDAVWTKKQFIGL